MSIQGYNPTRINMLPAGIIRILQRSIGQDPPAVLPREQLPRMKQCVQAFSTAIYCSGVDMS